MSDDGETITLLGRTVRVIDLSQRLSNTTSDHEPMPHRIEYLDHATAAADCRALLRRHGRQAPRRRPLGGRARLDHDALGHARRRAVPLPPDVRWQARADDRRGAVPVGDG